MEKVPDGTPLQDVFVFLQAQERDRPLYREGEPCLPLALEEFAEEKRPPVPGPDRSEARPKPPPPPVELAQALREHEDGWVRWAAAWALETLLPHYEAARAQGLPLQEPLCPPPPPRWKQVDREVVMVTLGVAAVALLFLVLAGSLLHCSPRSRTCFKTSWKRSFAICRPDGCSPWSWLCLWWLWVWAGPLGVATTKPVNG